LCNFGDGSTNLLLAGHVIAVMLECGSHHENPVEQSEGCNGFIVNCLHRLPLEVFSKSNRETIMKAWPSDTPDVDYSGTISYTISPLDPAVLSLKLKMMHRPTLYDVGTHNPISEVFLLTIYRALNSRTLLILPKE